MTQPPVAVSGRRLLVAVALWAPLAAALFALIAGPLRLLAPAFARAHAAAAGGLLLLVAYLALLAALAVAFGGPAPAARTLGLRYTSALHLALAPALWALVITLGAAASIPLIRVFGPPQNSALELVRASRDPFFLPLVVPTVALIGPLAEELLFRGGLYGWLRGRLGAIAAALVSAALFSAAHRSAAASALLFVFGLAAAIFYDRTRSTLNTTAMHACQNTVALVLALTVAGRF